MLVSGLNDESTPVQNRIMLDALKTDKCWHLLPNSNHMTYYYEHDVYVEFLREFINRIDKEARE